MKTAMRFIMASLLLTSFAFASEGEEEWENADYIQQLGIYCEGSGIYGDQAKFLFYVNTEDVINEQEAIEEGKKAGVVNAFFVHIMEDDMRESFAVPAKIQYKVSEEKTDFIVNVKYLTGMSFDTLQMRFDSLTDPDEPKKLTVTYTSVPEGGSHKLTMTCETPISDMLGE
jgi:hypothetical protein